MSQVKYPLIRRLAQKGQTGEAIYCPHQASHGIEITYRYSFATLSALPQNHKPASDRDQLKQTAGKY